MSRRNQVRIAMTFFALMVGSFLYSFIKADWADYWLSSDSKTAQAAVIDELSHGVVVYKYVVNNKEYLGQSQPEPTQNLRLRIGDKAVVNYSPSHPWLSSLQNPVFPAGGLGGLIALAIAGSIEFFIVATIINPKGRWALKTGLTESD